jgi:hypothetical protein
LIEARTAPGTKGKVMTWKFTGSESDDLEIDRKIPAGQEI